MSDQRTIDGVLADDQTAWDTLVARFTGPLWSVVRAYDLSPADAADAVQGTWLRLVESLHTIRDPALIGPWLFTTARREAALLSRRRRGERLVADPADAEHARSASADFGQAHADPMLAVLTADEGRRLWQAVDEMHEPCRSLFRLMASAPDAGVRQLAGRLGMPSGSYGPTRGRCLNRLRTMLTAREATP
ncbi:RNA polymerase sigma factor (sigma-70 family) [Streptosporangium becharense]|uniref:RNA polymerase sigma factor (Sigma-70 family) n=1 Tax=Streptosporangium becharense TaxID=1816182 RepID=A0A7W9MJ71_9ACTN|nr:sigma-70 family RNA polymerase sigma factor [Streptosporangium becharense]MBB2913226.1 RNA polymerase sigma factor (sigma-70 family) [Streptosporangium becharense]MBB5822209.1 RNA polymerase sigma factor (sigma-70 family) [Streptosporangium becharense]